MFIENKRTNENHRHEGKQGAPSRRSHPLPRARLPFPSPASSTVVSEGSTWGVGAPLSPRTVPHAHRRVGPLACVSQSTVMAASVIVPTPRSPFCPDQEQQQARCEISSCCLELMRLSWDVPGLTPWPLKPSSPNSSPCSFLWATP